MCEGKVDGKQKAVKRARIQRTRTVLGKGAILIAVVIPHEDSECVAVASRYCPLKPLLREYARRPFRNRTGSGVAVGHYWQFD